MLLPTGCVLLRATAKTRGERGGVRGRKSKETLVFLLLTSYPLPLFHIVVFLRPVEWTRPSLENLRPEGKEVRILHPVFSDLVSKDSLFRHAEALGTGQYSSLSNLQSM